MMLRFLLVIVTVGAASAAGCTTDDDLERLSGACQTQRCVCAAASWSPASAGGDVPVRWRPDGSAYCPDGLVLQRLQPRPARQY
ncbi:MAG: hypothetical protein IPK78_05930 [Rhodospirillales bacterium]|nr:hypothetical protein [Rhodospirillales bacterium]